MVVITGVSKSIDCETIVKDCGCTSARRITRKEMGTTVPTTAVVLTYPKDKAPKKVKLGYLCLATRVYVKKPVMCFKCNGYGHIAKHCLKKTKCPVCAEAHTLKDCPNRQNGTKLCSSCGSKEHHTGQSICPMKIRAATINRVMAKEGLSYAQAVKNLPSTVIPTTKGKTTAGQQLEGLLKTKPQQAVNQVNEGAASKAVSPVPKTTKGSSTQNCDLVTARKTIKTTVKTKETDTRASPMKGTPNLPSETATSKPPVTTNKKRRNIKRLLDTFIGKILGKVLAEGLSPKDKTSESIHNTLKSLATESLIESNISHLLINQALVFESEAAGEFSGSAANRS